MGPGWEPRIYEWQEEERRRQVLSFSMVSFWRKPLQSQPELMFDDPKDEGDEQDCEVWK